ncbi:MAG: 50S ribosomal protein L4 [Halothiobacillaceae bacterium]|jgi:large subunit ribosomal protein L4|nr:50S ribosomal protein L4 [Halothiobacillaceae bacterium]MDY0049522.1 50S ribosomal protein L4 [Halothiobacillaceae bacterium]
MEIKLHNGGQLSVSDAVFARNYNEGLVHQVVVAYMAGARAGTKRQLSRSEVSGGNVKPWRQKGTGRARHGSTRTPIWRTGGVTFAARPRNFEQKVNRKMYRAAISVILSELLRQDRLHVVDNFTIEAPKTRMLVGALRDMGLTEGRRLIVTDGFDENVYLASRNVIELGYLDVAALDPVSLVGADRVLITAAALKMIEEWLS